MGSHIEHMAAAHQAAIDRAEDDACRLEAATEQVRKELRIAMLIALSGAATTVPCVIPETMVRARRVGEISISDAIADAYFSERAQELVQKLDQSPCLYAQNYLSLCQTRNFVQLDAAELAMYERSTCPTVQALRLALADAYADQQAGEIAAMEEMDRAYRRGLQ